MGDEIEARLVARIRGLECGLASCKAALQARRMALRLLTQCSGEEVTKPGGPRPLPRPPPSALGRLRSPPRGR